MITIIVIFLMFYFIGKSTAKKIKPCAPHKWYYDDFGQMRCERCHQVPE